MVVVRLAGVRLAVALLAVVLLVAVLVVGRVVHGNWRLLWRLLCPMRAFAGVLPTGWCSGSTFGGPALCLRRVLMWGLSSLQASREAVEAGVLKQGGCC